MSIRTTVGALLAASCLLSVAAHAADLAPPAAPEPPPVAREWTIRFVPYAWLISLSGSQTVKGRTSDVDASFSQLFHETVQKGGSLFGLMGDLELRSGPWSLFTNAVWNRMSLDRDGMTARSLAPGVTGRLGASAGMTVQMAIVEAGATYEVARFGVPFGDVISLPASLDILGGVRYWSQQADLNFTLGAGILSDDLQIVRSLGVAKSGTVNWADPFVGARVKMDVAPGQMVFLRGDVGGFGVGSKFSWQTIAGYGFDFAQKDGVTYSGMIGVRALYVDYAQGEGRSRYAFDMLQYGPIFGLSIRY